MKMRTNFVAIYICSLMAHVIQDQQFLISNKGLCNQFFQRQQMNEFDSIKVFRHYS